MDFSSANIDLEVLKKRAYNMRWAEVEDGVIPLTAADTDFKPAPEISEAMIEYIKGDIFPILPSEDSRNLRKVLQGL